MSRPRRPFGSSQPGRLPATMMKVLAAEMSEPARLRRGKRYAADGAVIDIDVGVGVVTCEVQGSRPEPYVAALEVTAGDGMPLRRDVSTHCTCPDGDWDDHACKHVIAAMFAFADELLIEPELLDVWRGIDRGRVVDTSTRVGRESPENELRHLRLVRGGNASTTDRADGDVTAGDHDRSEPARAAVDPLAALLAVPEGGSIPAVPRLEPFELRPAKRRDLAVVLRDALANVRLDWD